MAVSILNAFAAASASDPNGVQTISAGTQRLCLLPWLAEYSSQVTHSTNEVGGVSATDSERGYWSNGADDQHAYGYWWNDAAISSFADNDIDFNDGVSLTKQSWTFGTLAGVDQTTPVISTFESPATDANLASINVLDITTASVAGDMDFVFVSRSSGNRSIAAVGTDTTEIIQTNVSFTAYVGYVAGGSGTIRITGDGISADMTYTHLIIKAATAAADGLMAKAMNEGLLRG